MIWLQQTTAWVRQGKRNNGDNDDDLASAPNGGYNGKRTTVRRRYDGENGQRQLQNNTHNNEEYRVCVRIRVLTPESIGVTTMGGWVRTRSKRDDYTQYDYGLFIS